MTVTAPAGFEAAGIAAGIKRTGALDLALIVNRGPSNASPMSAVFAPSTSAVRGNCPGGSSCTKRSPA